MSNLIILRSCYLNEFKCSTVQLYSIHVIKAIKATEAMHFTTECHSELNRQRKNKQIFLSKKKTTQTNLFNQ